MHFVWSQCGAPRKFSGAGRGSKGYFRVTTPGLETIRTCLILLTSHIALLPALSDARDRQAHRAERDEDQDGIDLDGLVDPQARVGRSDQGDEDEDDEGPGQLGHDV